MRAGMRTSNGESMAALYVGADQIATPPNRRTIKYRSAPDPIRIVEALSVLLSGRDREGFDKLCPNGLGWAVPSTAPELTTERLRLRAHQRDDAAQLMAMWQDPAVVRHFGGQPVAEEDSWNRLLRYIGHWSANGFGLWAVEEQATGRYIGDVGLFEGRRRLGDRFDDAPEAGWVLSPAGHGKGYAREAVAAALRWGEGEHGWQRTVCMIDPDNAPSFRTAQALGYAAFDRCAYRTKEVVLLERASG